VTALIVIGFTLCSFSLALLAGCPSRPEPRVWRDLDPALGDDFCRDRDGAA